MSEPIVIRPARRDDDSPLRAIEREAWDARSGFPSKADPEREKFFHDEQHQPDGYTVAEHKGHIIGAVQLVPVAPILEASHVMLLQGLMVSPQARGIGVAGALINEAINQVSSRGGRKLMLYVFGTNTPAIRLYERHGFAVEARLKDQFLIGGNYVDSITMSKHL